MRTKTYFDIRGFSFDEFVAFLFDRTAPVKAAALGATGDWPPWYLRSKGVFDPHTVCGHYVRMFRQPTFLLQRYSKDQLDQGFWAMQSSLNCSAHSLIWNTDLPFAEREKCVRSMAVLFRELFYTEPLDTSVCMWWDGFCYDWHCGNRKRESGGEDMAMQDVMFETLVEILALPSNICQGAALHGLSHLHHPSTGKVILGYLSQNPALDDEWKSVALAAARFELM